jgi:hypothetical protein
MRIAVALWAMCACGKSSTVIKIDGELGEPAWSQRAERHVFMANGEHARPFSEVRLFHDDTTLYVGLYAADENIQSSDFFDVKIGATAFHINPKADVTPAIPGLRAAVELDGSLDDNSNDDEEWVLEIAMPRTSGAMQFSRCDTPKDKIQRCASWSGTLQ